MPETFRKLSIEDLIRESETFENFNVKEISTSSNSSNEFLVDLSEHLADNMRKDDDKNDLKYNLFSSNILIDSEKSMSANVHGRAKKELIDRTQSFKLNFNSNQKMKHLRLYNLPVPASLKLSNSIYVRNGEFTFDIGQVNNYFTLPSHASQVINLVENNPDRTIYDLDFNMKHYDDYQLKAGFVKKGNNLHINFNTGNKVVVNFLYTYKNQPRVSFKRIEGADIIANNKEMKNGRVVNGSLLAKLGDDPLPKIHYKPVSRIFSIDQEVKLSDFMKVEDYKLVRGRGVKDTAQGLVLSRNHDLIWKVKGSEFNFKPFKRMYNQNNVGVGHTKIGDRTAYTVDRKGLTDNDNILSSVALKFKKAGRFSFKVGVMDSSFQTTYKDIMIIVR